MSGRKKERGVGRRKYEVKKGNRRERKQDIR